MQEIPCTRRYPPAGWIASSRPIRLLELFLQYWNPEEKGPHLPSRNAPFRPREICGGGPQQSAPRREPGETRWPTLREWPPKGREPTCFPRRRLPCVQFSWQKPTFQRQLSVAPATHFRIPARAESIRHGLRPQSREAAVLNRNNVLHLGGAQLPSITDEVAF
jgi:hypothetical protein